MTVMTACSSGCGWWGRASCQDEPVQKIWSHVPSRDSLAQPLPTQGARGQGRSGEEVAGGQCGWMSTQPAPICRAKVEPAAVQAGLPLIHSFNSPHCLPPQGKYFTNCCLASTTGMKAEVNQLDFWQGLPRWWHVSLITPEALTPPHPSAVLCRASLHVGGKSDVNLMYQEESRFTVRRRLPSAHVTRALCPRHTHIAGHPRATDSLEFGGSQKESQLDLLFQGNHCTSGNLGWMGKVKLHNQKTAGENTLYILVHGISLPINPYFFPLDFFQFIQERDISDS